MARVCTKDECEYPVFGGNFCRNHQYLREDKKQKELKRTPLKSRVKFISPISEREKKRLAKYRPIRDKFLKENPVCMIEGCNGKSELHHFYGRIGDYLWDVRYFKNLCRKHHTQVEENPEFAYENGLSGKRNNKEN